LRYQFIQRGEGKMAEGTAAVHYEGSLESESFWSLLIQEKPIEFKLGQGQVIEGWDEGIALLKLVTKLVLYSVWFRLYRRWRCYSTKRYFNFDVELMDVK
jgi:peptidyl-prolyl cis-trans isomerase A (cyclophilin A)